MSWNLFNKFYGILNLGNNAWNNVYGNLMYEGLILKKNKSMQIDN